MPALKTRNDIGPFRQPVDNFAFSFVAPLGPDNNDIGHNALSFADYRARHSGPNRAVKQQNAPLPLFLALYTVRTLHTRTQ
ncbi:hypothetical protein NBRC116593_07350 [Sulfitobacter pacificus]